MLHSIENAHLRLTASEQGAELMSLLSAGGTEYLWQGDPAYWADRAPNLFPYVGRMTEGSYYLDGQRYQMRIHGTALYSRFLLEEKTRSAMTFLYTDDAESYAQYPRHFAFRVRYALQENQVRITYQVENRDTRTLYFGLGGHPGFQVPLGGQGRFEDYRIRFTRPCEPVQVGFSPACFRNGQDAPYPLEENGIPLRHDLFDADAIVLKDICREVVLEGSGHRVRVTFPQMGFLGLWHMPKTDAPYVCIEPWASLPSWQDQIAVLEEQEDLLRLEAGQVLNMDWSITLE